MALTDEITGSLSFLARFLVTRSNPQGRDVYEMSYNAALSNTEATGDDTAFRVRGAFHEIITVTTASQTISLADSAGPMGGLGSNVPSADPEGATLKLLAFKNLTPTDGTGQTVFVSFGETLGTFGPVLSYSTLGKLADSALEVIAGGMVAFFGPQGHNPAMNDGVDDEIAVKVLSGTADLEVLYAFA